MHDVVHALPVSLALLSALASSVSLVLQRDTSRDAPAGIRWWQLLAHLLGQPLWLLGNLSWLIALVLQALALHFGPLAVVQPLLISELVFVLLIRRFVMRWPVRGAAWWSAALLAASLAVFLAAAHPHGGHPFPTAGRWIGALVACASVVVIAVVLGRDGTPARRGACYATAAAVLAALEASLLKTLTQELSDGGLLEAFTHWQLYAFAASGLVSGVLVQAALRVGPLTVSQPLLVVLNPLTSIVLSVWLFGEHFSTNPPTVVLGGVAFVGVLFGVVLLTATGPHLHDARAPGKPSSVPDTVTREQ